MLDTHSTDFPQQGDAKAYWRRALLIGERIAAKLQQRLRASGYETLTATIADGLHVIAERMPDVVIIELQHNKDGDKDCFALARRLRAEPATYALPLVFVWSEEARHGRNAALSVGADDYFALSTSLPALLARLDALFWRAEAGRRAAFSTSDLRLEIDNFALLLDGVHEDMCAGVKGTLAIVDVVSAREGDEELDKSARDRTLAKAYGFLKLNLRRADSIVFYRQTRLLLYLPRVKARTAATALSYLSKYFSSAPADGQIIIGLASFPDDGSDVETVIGKAEEAAGVARTNPAQGRVVAYETKEMGEATQTTSQMKGASVQPVINEAVTPASSSAHEAHSDLPIAHKSKMRVTTSEGNEKLQSGDVDAMRAASEAAAASERERRASGTAIPCRLLLTISNATRMAQLNSLIRSAGYEARAAFDSQQALNLLRIEPFDLLLLDYEMNGMDGLEMLRRLRKQSGDRLTLPVVLLISPENESVHKQALEIGVHSVLTMPYEPADLLTKVRLAGGGG